MILKLKIMDYRQLLGSLKTQARRLYSILFAKISEYLLKYVKV